MELSISHRYGLYVIAMGFVGVALMSGCGGGSGGSSNGPKGVQPVSTIGSNTKGATEIALSPKGDLAVMDTKSNVIEYYDWTGKYLSSIPTSTMAYALDEPEGLVYDDAGYLYVGDTTNRRILKIDQNGNVVLTFTKGAVPQLLLDSEGLGTDSVNHLLYVCDVATNRIEVFDSVTGNWLRNIPSTGVDPGTGNGQFHIPLSIATDQDHNIYVADCENNRIQKFDSAGNFLLAWGQLGTANGQFNQPVAVRLDPAGKVYVYDSLNDRIQVFGQDGTWLKTIPVKHHKKIVSEKESTGLYIDAAGTIYLVSFDTGKIDIYLQS